MAMANDPEEDHRNPGLKEAAGCPPTSTLPLFYVIQFFDSGHDRYRQSSRSTEKKAVCCGMKKGCREGDMYVVLPLNVLESCALSSCSTLYI